MGNSLRCCLACVIPCGALDVIRIVHLNGYVEEITRPISAGEVLKANPNHKLSKPCSQGVVRRILILSPETELKRGSIYFLIPESSMPVPESKRRSKKRSRKSKTTTRDHHSVVCRRSNNNIVAANNDCDQYLEEIISNNISDSDSDSDSKKSSRHKGRGRPRQVGVWRPHLDIITEERTD